MTQVAEKLQPWLAALEERPHGGPRWLQDLRDHAASRVSSTLGFPTVRDEEWRFTNVAPIASTEFRLAPARRSSTPAALDAFRLRGRAVSAWSSSTAASSPSCRGRRACRPGLRFGSLAAAVDRAGRHRRPLSRPARRVRRARVRRAQHRVHARRRATSTCPTASCSSSRFRSCSSRRRRRVRRRRCRTRGRSSSPATDSQAQIVETYVGAAGPEATSPTP